MGLVTKEGIFIIVFALSVLVVFNGIIIMFIGTIFESKHWYTQFAILLGGVVDSLTGLIFLAFSITFL